MPAYTALPFSDVSLFGSNTALLEMMGTFDTHTQQHQQDQEQQHQEQQQFHEQEGEQVQVQVQRQKRRKITEDVEEFDNRSVIWPAGDG
jgi:hypothetical protein